jgi:hypothetical protein
VPRLCEVYPGICLTTEEEAWKNLSQGSWRMPAGKEYNQLAKNIYCLKKIIVDFYVPNFLNVTFKLWPITGTIFLIFEW